MRLVPSRELFHWLYNSYMLWMPEEHVMPWRRGDLTWSRLLEIQWKFSLDSSLRQQRDRLYRRPGIHLRRGAHRPSLWILRYQRFSTFHHRRFLWMPGVSWVDLEYNLDHCSYDHLYRCPGRTYQGKSLGHEIHILQHPGGCKDLHKLHADHLTHNEFTVGLAGVSKGVLEVVTDNKFREHQFTIVWLLDGWWGIGGESASRPARPWTRLHDILLARLANRVTPNIPRHRLPRILGYL